MPTYYYLPTRNVFGEGAVQEVGALFMSLNVKNAMIVTDKFLAQTDMVGRITRILADSGIASVIFDGAEPNPTDKNVEAGVSFFHANNCDSIISLGGGSSHDCAKGIGLVASNGGTIHDYEGVDKAAKDVVPLMAINTTAGTASEITRFCNITDTTRKVKMAIVDWRVTPRIAVNDPELMRGMPTSLTAATGMDAMTHAIEAYVSTDANVLTDSAALMAVKMIYQYLPKVVANGSYMKARDKMAYAQYLAGIAFNNASLGYVHAMAREDKRPMLSDLRESGAIEQDADIVIFLYREDYYKDDTENQNIAECIVAKNRHGERCKLPLRWMPEYTTFSTVEMRFDEE